MGEEINIKDIRIAYAELPPFVEIKTEDGTEVLGGIMPDIVSTIVHWMRLNATWIREPEDKYGTWENNTWTGMCGMLFRNEVDIILNPLLPSAEYAEVVDYSTSVIFEAFTFLSGKKKQDGGLFLYFSVLEPTVWISIGIALLIIAATSALLFRSLSKDKWGDWIFAVGQYLWIYVAYMLRQAPSEKWMLRDMKSILSIILLILIMLWIIGVSFLVMTVFQSLLVSKLTIIKSLPIVDSMQDLLNQKNIKGVTAREIELQEVLKDSGIPLYERTWEKLEPEMVFIDEVLSEKSFDEVEKGTTCIVHGNLILRASLRDYYISHGKCNFHLSENYFFAFPLLIGIKRTLPVQFRRKFNSGLTRLIGIDIIGKWFKSIFEECHLCTSYSENDLKPLEFKNILGVLVIWAGGIFLSSICLIAELISNKRQRIDLQTKRKRGKVMRKSRLLNAEPSM